MTQPALLDASCRVALAALLHDLGKFAERAGLEVTADSLATHKTEYCRFHQEGGYHSHVHGAYTALAFDRVVPRELREKNDLAPFAAWGGQGADDSLINAAARHHRPETFLQWIIATADRVASGFEREKFEIDYNQKKERPNYLRARQLTLFEQIRPDGAEVPESELVHRYPLKALAPETLFPKATKDCEPNNDKDAHAHYRALWDAFVKGLDLTPASHRANLALWLDHFDSLWLAFTHAIPSATAFEVKPEVSLYDHSKAVAALAVALWRQHRETGTQTLEAVRDDWQTDKFLLVQGDFFGIQNFIFAGGNHTNKHAAKLLRGRSFYVCLITELAALKILDALELPATSQIVNAAGKFLIVAPNTANTREKLAQAQRDINAWFLQHSFGEAGIGLATLPASCDDFQRKERFAGLMSRLFEQLEATKLQRFGLCGANAPPAVFAGALERYRKGACELNGKLPAENEGRNALSSDQVKIGESLAKKTRLLITRQSLGHNPLKLPIFGYCVNFTDEEDKSGKFGKEAESGNLRRAWDFSMAGKGEGERPLWNGYARRAVNAFAPEFDADALAWDSKKYGKWESEIDFDPNYSRLKTFNHIACEDRQQRDDSLEKWRGQTALMTLKGDIDNLGALFQRGLAEPTFAKMAALSRQINAFFAVWLPWYCAENYPDTYTVFAGGDDFFLIGPWHSTLKLARAMRREFVRYVAGNAQITFSAGLVMTKPGLPIRYLAETAEEALEAAKAFPAGRSVQAQRNRQALAPPPELVGSAALEPTYIAQASTKNAVCAYGIAVDWDDFGQLLDAGAKLDELLKDHNLSMGYRYGLLHLADMAGSRRPEDAIWRAHLAYRTRRYVADKIGDKDRAQALHNRLVDDIGEKGIKVFEGAYKIALFTHLYQYRD